MIKVTDLSKNYDTVEAVKSISFDLNDGEIIGFLGANGAGKTTTLKMITGYLVPTKGEIKINDLDIHENIVSNTRPPGAIGVGLSLDPEGRLKVMGSI